ncbi:hypothetical protein MESS2_570004 [Mesorhizobium metallidurans STM 2683]|uniref:Uncharacterized protein n=1 Tax=Mesorhizobium metallidurans STM 2683 TaxID=1297569 RepID=M5ETU9_9HYPH|nr:hypothetical protein MESS2_570004 [Mesorhizobium metallidurans STM 2683]
MTCAMSTSFKLRVTGGVDTGHAEMKRGGACSFESVCGKLSRQPLLSATHPSIPAEGEVGTARR